MNLLQTDIKRALISWGFIAATAGMAVVLFFGSFDSLIPLVQNAMGGGPPAGFHEQILITAMHSDVMLLCVPILAALPYTAAFVDDCKSGYLKEYLPRTGVGPYIQGKVLASGVSGGLALFAGIILVWIIFALVFTPMEILPQVQDGAATGGAAIAKVAEAGQQGQQAGLSSMFPQILAESLLFFLAGAFWSLVGALFAALTQSRYMAYAFPFILYYVLIILTTRYFTGLFILNPQEWVRDTMEWPGGMWGLALFLGELIIAAAVTYAIVIKRRLADV